MKIKRIIPLVVLFGLAACTTKEDVKKVIKQNPEIVIEALEANKDQFLDFLDKLSEHARKTQAERRKKAEAKKLEEAFSKPLKPEIRADESFRGPKDAPITLVEYSDFECPFCSRAYNTVMEFMKKYDGKVRFVYKHLPLSFHPNAEVASRYYEAIRLQSEEKAFKFHDEVYKQQGKLKAGEKFLKKVAGTLGLNMGKLAKDVKSPAVKARVKADMDEAAKFGFSGTPGFLLNGIPIKGAYPLSHFDMIIEKLKSQGKLKI